MSNWAVIDSPRFDDMLGISGDGGTTVTSGGSAHTKGSWTDLGTTTYDWESFDLFFTEEGGGYDQLIDIAINQSGTYRVLVTDFAMGHSYNGSKTAAANLTIPVRVPKGAVISARTQAGFSSNACKVAVRGKSRSLLGAVGFSSMEAITAITNSMPTVSITLASGSPAYTQLVASTAKRYGALLVSPHNNDTSADALGLLDIGIGASDNPLVNSIIFRQLGFNILINPLFVPMNIPAGSRLSARIRSSSSTAVRRVALYGLVT